MDEALRIREAAPNDAEAACALIRSSIVTLCDADHGSDRDRLAAWLANKTPENMRLWIAGGHVFLAEREGELAGVGALTLGGEITLLYVAPERRFTGVSKALLLAIEERARDLGIDQCRLTATVTSERLYRSAGYAPAPDGRDRRMSKDL